MSDLSDDSSADLNVVKLHNIFSRTRPSMVSKLSEEDSSSNEAEADTDATATAKATATEHSIKPKKDSTSNQSSDSFTNFVDYKQQAAKKAVKQKQSRTRIPWPSTKCTTYDEDGKESVDYPVLTDGNYLDEALAKHVQHEKPYLAPHGKKELEWTKCAKMIMAEMDPVTNVPLFSSLSWEQARNRFLD